MRQAFPELFEDNQFMDQIIEDLGTRNLIAVKWMFQEQLPDIGPYTKRTGRKSFFGTLEISNTLSPGTPR
jgi:hypothetical protein